MRSRQADSTTRWRFSWLFVLFLCSSLLLGGVQAFSANLPPPHNNQEASPSIDSSSKEDPAPVISRRDVFDWPFVAVGTALATGQIVSTLVTGLSLSRPAAHEQRVADTLRRALVEAAPTSSGALRVLEVGIGADCRLIRRGLYNQAIAKLGQSSNVKELSIVGMDLQAPKADKIKDAQLLLDQFKQSTGVKSTLQVQAGSITSGLPQFADGSFDAVICCLTLCSVSDPHAAIAEMQRLTRPSGGTFGYVEHVAVNPDEPYRFLELQQTIFDPLQQLVADNCHLRRFTQETIHEVFGDKATILQENRFLVDKMWPVSSQSCGVLQRRS